MTRKKVGGPLGPLIGLFSSFGLACVLLMCLFVLVLAATLQYGQIGEAGVKQKFFIPWFISMRGLPFPGGSLVFSLLGLNLLTGGLVRIRWAWRTAGIITAHLGIVGLVVAGVVNFTTSDYGAVMLYEGSTKNTYRDYTEIEVAIWDAEEVSDVTEFVVEDSDVRSCAGQVRVFESAELPFKLELSGFLPHCKALPKGPRWDAESPVVAGWALDQIPESSVDPHVRVPGLVARVTADQGSETVTGLLTSSDVFAWTVEAGGKLWALNLRHVQHRLPFGITLVDTTREDHPGTDKPRVYKSEVIYGDRERQTTISMNQPLREEGHVLYQSNWGRDRRGEYSGFSVARNPSDQWPKWSCWVIGLGLLLAFVQRLYAYTLAQARARAKGA